MDFQNATNPMLRFYLEAIVRELFKRHCSNTLHCEKCFYIYSECCEKDFRKDMLGGMIEC